VTKDTKKNDIGAYIFISELHVEHIACPSCILEGARRSFTGHLHFDCPVSLIWIKRECCGYILLEIPIIEAGATLQPPIKFT